MRWMSHAVIKGLHTGLSLVDRDVQRPQETLDSPLLGKLFKCLLTQILANHMAATQYFSA